jgi:hypothetical protein
MKIHLSTAAAAAACGGVDRFVPVVEDVGGEANGYRRQAVPKQTHHQPSLVDNEV